jgi:opacity protein-like surface antigen
LVRTLCRRKFWRSWTSGSLNIPGNNFHGGLTEFVGGVQAGYNFQAGNFLYGVEATFDWATFDHPTLPFPTLGSVSQHWIGTAAARIGVVQDRWLVYGKVGGGWVRSTAEINAFGQTWNGSSTKDGWLVGGGIEYGFKSHWTVGLEYDFLALADWNSPTVATVALNRDVQMVTAKINYKFQSGISDAIASASRGYSRDPSEDEDLAKKSQNPIADLVSVPFQSNTNFNAGPFNRTQEVLNIQPVVPLHISADWNLISRTIVPVISQPDPILDPQKRTFAHSWKRWWPDRPTPRQHRRADNQRLAMKSATVSPSHGRAGVTKSIRSIYTDYGTQWQEVAIPPQHGRIKAGRATAVQKQSVLASKLIPEKTRELVKRNF